MIKHESWNVGGTIVKRDDRYLVQDNTELNNLVISSTTLFPFKSTTGHKHYNCEEVYIFVEGSGTMELDNEKFDVMSGDIVPVRGGVFHRVHAGENGCYFICVFEGAREE